MQTIRLRKPRQLAMVISLAAILSMTLAPIAYAETDTTPPKGSFPTLVSGDTPIPISPVFTMGTRITDDTKVTEIHLYLDGIETASGTSGITYTLTYTDDPTEVYFLYSWSVTEATNGVHTIKVKAVDAAGNAGWVTAGNQDHVTLLVNEPPKSTPEPQTPAPTPVKLPQAASDTADAENCANNEVGINRVLKRIVDRKAERLAYNDRIRDEIQRYSAANSLPIDSTYRELTSKIQQAQENAISTRQILAPLSTIDCTHSTQDQVRAFKAAVESNDIALRAYSQTLQDLIKSIHETN